MKLPAAETRSEEDSGKRERHVRDEPAGAGDDKVPWKESCDSWNERFSKDVSFSYANCI